MGSTSSDLESAAESAAQLEHAGGDSAAAAGYLGPTAAGYRASADAAEHAARCERAAGNFRLAAAFDRLAGLYRELAELVGGHHEHPRGPSEDEARST